MLKYIVASFVFLHGLIHLMGFAKAFNYGDMKQLMTPISKSVGVLWLMAAIFFILAAILQIIEKEFTWMIALGGVIISQIVIIQSWQDAKWGTLLNIAILCIAVIIWGSGHFEKSWQNDVRASLQMSDNIASDTLYEDDLKHLPAPVKRYLEYSGAIGKPKVKNMRAVLEMEMREKGKTFFPARSIQYNFFDEPTRLFFMKAKMFGLTVPGYHKFQIGNAVMDIRLFGLVSMVNKEGDVMNKAETVTVFNDMCLMAPASLIDRRIRWELIDDNTAKAIFTNRGITISAVLTFNEKGQLINFLSNDRTEINAMNNLPFSTPIHSYKSIRGFNVLERGDAVWEYPDGKFVYGKFKLIDIEYNVNQFKPG